MNDTKQQRCGNNEEHVKITIRTDKYPQETRYEILDNSRRIVQSDDFGDDNSNAEETFVVFNQCVRKNSICTLRIFDEPESVPGDGICCGFGSGYY